jgi:hypothetical protein
MYALRKRRESRKIAEKDCLVLVGERRDNSLDYPGVPLQVAYIVAKSAGKWRVQSEKEIPTYSRTNFPELFDSARVICTNRQRALVLLLNQNDATQELVMRVTDLDNSVSEVQLLFPKFRPLQKESPAKWTPKYLEYMPFDELKKVISAEEVVEERYGTYRQRFDDKLSNVVSGKEYFISHSHYRDEVENYYGHSVMELLERSGNEYAPRYWCYGRPVCKLSIGSLKTAIVLEDDASSGYSNYRVMSVEF